MTRLHITFNVWKFANFYVINWVKKFCLPLQSDLFHGFHYLSPPFSLGKEVSGVAVDPRTKCIVAVGTDKIEKHPLMHCATVLIDAVARSQNGGAWNNYLIENYEDDYTISGVNECIRKLIRSKYPTVRFGAERVKSVEENRQNPLNVDANIDNLAKYGPYLCTGYDVYLWKEPCVMCSMALTHSRIRNIFFHATQPTGAICTLAKLQSIKALNHHFQVFHITNS